MAAMDIKRLSLAEAEAFIEHLLRLSTDDRRLRFSGIVSDDFIVRHARTFLSQGTVFGLFVDGILRGVCQMISSPSPRSNGDSQHFEIALSIEHPWQKLGFGAALLAAAHDEAARLDAESLILSCLSENIGIRRLATRFKAEMDVRQGLMEALIRIGGPALGKNTPAAAGV